MNELLEHADDLNQSINYGFIPSKEEVEQDNNIEKYKNLVKHHSKSVMDLSNLSEIGGSG